MPSAGFIQDLPFIIWWWFIFFSIGIVFWPLTSILFSKFSDHGYAFSKIVGIALLSYVIFILGILHILPFFQPAIIAILVMALVGNFYIAQKLKISIKTFVTKVVLFEEILFASGLAVWSYVRGFEPSIHSLEKYMDFGFVNSILRSDYFPPQDMWFPPFPINYYYFGHLTTAFITKLSNIPPQVAYNLMIAVLFAFTLSLSFALIYQLLFPIVRARRAFLGGIVGAILMSLGGNLHTIYAFFAPYVGEKPVPFWTLKFLPNSFPNEYWYPNATRFISHTIHEFPLYSFVVSDLHGHVIDIPYVFLGIALLFTVLVERKITRLKLVFMSILLGIMYMTNIWDSVIYLLLTLFTLIVINIHTLRIVHGKKRHKILFFHTNFQSFANKKTFFFDVAEKLLIIVAIFIVATLPFNLAFKPFSSGIGILCAPEFLTKIGKIGPLLFEPLHCQRSPLYQLAVLYGFFYFFAISFLVFFISRLRKIKNQKVFASDIFVILLILLSTILITAPEFIYAKDIYPDHYRANTMFKLVYQSFLMMTMVAAYAFIRIPYGLKHLWGKLIFVLVSIVLIALVAIYPYFAIFSYYGELKQYNGLDGTSYLKTLFPGDLEAITYLNKNVQGQPVILEAQGDSYTDFERISANTGLPTVLGWTVHEWLWRGSYDIPSPRIDEVRKMYEGTAQETLPLLSKYHVSYVVIGDLERQKYPGLNTVKFDSIGKLIFTSTNGKTFIYEVN